MKDNLNNLNLETRGSDTPYKSSKSRGRGAISIGVKTLIDPETGQETEFTMIEKDIPKDYNFHKVWLQDILNVLDSFGNKKILVLTHLLKRMRSEDNSVSGSYREIAEDCKVSLPTVSAVMSELIESNVLKRIATATYQFNPGLIVRGGANKRKNLIIKYKYHEDERKQISNAKMIDIEPIHPNQAFFNFDEEKPYKMPDENQYNIDNE